MLLYIFSRNCTFLAREKNCFLKIQDIVNGQKTLILIL